MNATNRISSECRQDLKPASPKTKRLAPGTCAAIVSVLLCLAIVGGCGAARPNKYYQLTIPGDSPSAAPSNGVSLVIGPMVASHLYKDDRIAYSNGAEELGTYEYQRWAEPPAEMIGEVVLRQLRGSGHYKAVYSQRSDIHGDYLLRGRLYDFKEISGTSIMARVTAEWELKDLKTGATVLTGYYTHDEPVASKDVPAVVAALDRNVRRGVEELQGKLDQFLASVAGK
jgi:ABC-type uncharacterized transport system auxiliary subunit